MTHADTRNEPEVMARGPGTPREQRNAGCIPTRRQRRTPPLDLSGFPNRSLLRPVCQESGVALPIDGGWTADAGWNALRLSHPLA
jgi:hypothetical protein